MRGGEGKGKYASISEFVLQRNQICKKKNLCVFFSFFGGGGREGGRGWADFFFGGGDEKGGGGQGLSKWIFLKGSKSKIKKKPFCLWGGEGGARISDFFNLYKESKSEKKYFYCCCCFLGGGVVARVSVRVGRKILRN